MNKTKKTIRRQKRTREKLSRIVKRPRLSVFRSNQFVYAQLIDDVSGKTLVGISEKNMTMSGKETKTDRARSMGAELAAIAKKKGITTVVFDRGGYKYHGRVKAFADGAREGGLTF